MQNEQKCFEKTHCDTQCIIIDYSRTWSDNMAYSPMGVTVTEVYQKPSKIISTLQKFFNYILAENLDSLNLHGPTTVVNCLNPHSFVQALNDDEFRIALEQSDVLLPDGEGICLALKKWGNRTINKIAGDDLHRFLLEKLNNEHGKSNQPAKVYYMGSSQHVLDLITARLQREYPAVDVRTWSPSFCDKLSDEESLRIIDDINSFNPDILFVSMTAPKQEKWVACHRDRLSSPHIIASIGAVFDFYAGTVQRAPNWAVHLKIEWLYRLLKEPRRMWERNFVSTPKFLHWVYQHRNELKNSI